MAEGAPENKTDITSNGKTILSDREIEEASKKIFNDK